MIRWTFLLLVVLPTATVVRNQQLRFESPAQELSSLFRCGGGSARSTVIQFQCGVNYKRRRRPTPYQRRVGTPAAAAKSTRNICKNRIFWTKEVILLPGAAEDEALRGPRKSFLMNQGFIRSELEIYKNWSKVEMVEFIKST